MGYYLTTTAGHRNALDREKTIFDDKISIRTVAETTICARQADAAIRRNLVIRPRSDPFMWGFQSRQQLLQRRASSTRQTAILIFSSHYSVLVFTFVSFMARLDIGIFIYTLPLQCTQEKRPLLVVDTKCSHRLIHFQTRYFLSR